MQLRTHISTLQSYEDPPTNSNAVVGEFYFEFTDGTCFPGIGWIDRLISVLGWWIYPLTEHLMARTDSAKLLFGETSAGVVVQRVSADALKLRFMQDVVAEVDELREEMVLASTFLDNLAAVAAELDSALAAKGWPLSAHTAEVRRLRLLLTRPA